MQTTTYENDGHYTIMKIQAGKGVTVKDIDEAPTIEAEPVRHGEWIEYFAYGCWHYDCPLCDDGYATKERQIRLENYCQNCGAKMNGGTDNG